MNSDIGSLRISDDVIAVCAAKAALDTPGVSEMASGITDSISNSISKNILGKEPTTKGVRVSQNDEEIIIDLYIIVDYGVQIPSVAWDIQENVKKEIEAISGCKVQLVNIHVQGVHLNNTK